MNQNYTIATQTSLPQTPRRETFEQQPEQTPLWTRDLFSQIVDLSVTEMAEWP